MGTRIAKYTGDRGWDGVARLTAALLPFIPGIGSPLSTVLSGWVSEREFERIENVLQEVAETLAEQIGPESRKYILSEDFEDILAETLNRVARERLDGKRRLYAAFLGHKIQAPRENTYDESLRILRDLERIQWDLVRLLQAMGQATDQENGKPVPGPIALESYRWVKDQPTDHLLDIVVQLESLFLADRARISILFIDGEPCDLPAGLTAYGERFLAALTTSR